MKWDIYGCGMCDFDYDCIYPDCYLDGSHNVCYTDSTSDNHTEGTVFKLKPMPKISQDTYNMTRKAQNKAIYVKYCEMDGRPTEEKLTDEERALAELHDYALRVRLLLEKMHSGEELHAAWVEGVFSVMQSDSDA